MPSTRRSLLAATASATAGLAALAGCTGDRDAIERPIVERVFLRNHDDAAHRVALRVEVDGTVEHWATHRLAPAGEDDDTVVVEPPAYPAERTAYTVGVRRLDAGSRESVTPRVHEHACKELTFRVTEDGGLRQASTAHECGDETTAE